MLSCKNVHLCNGVVIFDFEVILPDIIFLKGCFPVMRFFTHVYVRMLNTRQ